VSWGGLTIMVGLVALVATAPLVGIPLLAGALWLFKR
jgi:hypothetical protein